MWGTSTVFDAHTTFDPAADFDAFVRSVPAKWVVYLLADAQDRPVQLLCVKNLRYSLKRRLGTEEDLGPSKRVNYRDLVRRIHWRRVDSALEADWLYYEAARDLFPKTYKGMVGFRPAWFVHVNPDADFPRYTRTTNLTLKTGVLIGPVEDKHAAARLIQLAEDAFDLCRYYNILVEAPRGRACAYKEMGKCPAPCDGTISMEQYRFLVRWSVETMVSPAAFIEDQNRRMRQAAADLNFEAAARVKTFIESLGGLGKGALRHVARFADFAFLALQQGPRDGTVKVFLIARGRIEHLVSLIAEPRSPSDLLRLAIAAGASDVAGHTDGIGAERVGIIAHHLFSPKQSHGVFLPLGEIEERALAKAFKELRRQRPADVEEEAEGVLKELRSMEPT